MNIETGKTYVDRDGQPHTILSHSCGKFFDGSTYYLESGQWTGDAYTPSNLDLVAEAQAMQAQEPLITKQQLDNFHREFSALTPAQTDTVSERAFDHGLVLAALDGKTLQYQRDDEWVDLPNKRSAIMCIVHGVYQVRLKPEPECFWLAVYLDAGGGLDFSIWNNRQKAQDVADVQVGRLHRIEIDPDSLSITVKEAP